VNTGTKTILTVKGMINMKLSQEAIQFANQLVNNYSKYDSDLGTYINIYDISDVDINKFATFFMNYESCSEATGPDNPEYINTMLPNLIIFMRNTSTYDSKIEFADNWTKGVRIYFNNKMQKVLDEICDQTNSEVA
jgi:hypothetical protein